MEVLILDQGRQALPFARSLRMAGHRVTIVCNTVFSEGFFSIYPHKRLLWPNCDFDVAGFECQLIQYLKANNVDVVVSLGDKSTTILATNQHIIKQYSKITLPEFEVFDIATDKLNLMVYCMKNDIPCPKTFIISDLIDKQGLSKMELPLLVKPRKGIGAIGLRIFDNVEDIIREYEALTNQFGPLLVQEYIPQKNGMQYQAEAFLNEDSKLVACVVINKPRFFPVNGGTSSANVTIDHPEIAKTVKRLLEGIRWKGAADVDLILDPRSNTIKVLEINPRVTAGIKIAFAAGIDFADLHMRLALGKPVPEAFNYKKGIYCRNFLLEVLWYMFSSKEMKRNTQPPFFKIFGKNIIDQTISYKDPFAALGFALNTLFKYMSIKRLREKLKV